MHIAEAVPYVYAVHLIYVCKVYICITVVYVFFASYSSSDLPLCFFSTTLSSYQSVHLLFLFRFLVSWFGLSRLSVGVLTISINAMTLLTISINALTWLAISLSINSLTLFLNFTHADRFCFRLQCSDWENRLHIYLSMLSYSNLPWNELGSIASNMFNSVVPLHRLSFNIFSFHYSFSRVAMQSNGKHGKTDAIFATSFMSLSFLPTSTMPWISQDMPLKDKIRLASWYGKQICKHL